MRSKRADHRIFLAIATVAICASAANVMFFVQLLRTPSAVKRTDISRYAERFEALRAALPSRGTVGYYSDDTEDEGLSRNRFHVARFALTPVILVRSTDFEVVVGNFQSAAHARDLVQRGFSLRQDFGGGLMLFRKTR